MIKPCSFNEICKMFTLFFLSDAVHIQIPIKGAFSNTLKHLIFIFKFIFHLLN